MELHAEFIEFLENELKAFEIELRDIKELPSVESLRSRIKKDKRDTEAMLAVYRRIKKNNINIRAVKAESREIMVEIKRQLGRKLSKIKRKYEVARDTSYDL